MNALELRVPPLALLFISCLLIGLIALGTAPLPWAYTTRVGIGGSAAIAGLLIAWSGVVSFRRARTTVNPLRPEAATSLVASGIYRYTRNPMYLGMLLVLIGWTVFLARPWALAVLPAFVAYMNRFQIGPEERALEGVFGGEFEAYRRRVRRWL
ncbi:MAG TPA: isoprenylcysteine carboxylmethyltransferase family protein [Xanthomonadales bacterium]|nr:isoprenylcysteine carboxylmethyltransferase family protein [Xanthomonadales bacterium]